MPAALQLHMLETLWSVESLANHESLEKASWVTVRFEKLARRSQCRRSDRET